MSTNTINPGNTNVHQADKASPAQIEEARLKHDRELEEEAKRLEKEVEDARHTHELEERVKHLKQELDDAKHPHAPLPWPLNHLHGQADGEGGTEVAVVVTHPGEEVSGHVVDAVQADHAEHTVEAVADHSEHVVEAAPEPVHHDATVVDHDGVA